MWLVNDAAVGHGRGHIGHLQRGRKDEALTDRGIGRVAWAPAFPGIVLRKPSGSRHHTRGYAVEREFCLLAQTKHATYRVDLVDTGGIAVLIEEGIAGILDRRGQILTAMGRYGRLGGEHPALHVLVAVLDAPRALELPIADTRPDTG